PIRGGSGVFEGQVPLTDIIERVDPAGSKGMTALSGHIVNSVTGAPIQGASVSLYGSNPFGQFDVRGSALPFQLFDETTTAGDGLFTLRALAGWQYGIRVELNGYRILQTVITVAGRPLPPLALRLHPVTSVTLRPTGPGGKRVTGAQGYVAVNWGSAIVEGGPVSANPDGDLVIGAPWWDVPLEETSRDEPVSVTLAARSNTDGYAIRHLEGWPPGPLPMPLLPAASITGIVVDENGHSLRNVPLLITRTAHTPDPGTLPELPIWVTTQTDAGGHFTVSALPRGNYSIIETYNGRQFRALIVHLTGDHADVTVRPTEQ
nr:carboxypeptidase regulatory-like domain-containing protein [Armatimonadota bacterium]